jgi:hypothetical protein
VAYKQQQDVLIRPLSTFLYETQAMLVDLYSSRNFSQALVLLLP